MFSKISFSLFFLILKISNSHKLIIDAINKLNNLKKNYIVLYHMIDILCKFKVCIQ